MSNLSSRGNGFVHFNTPTSISYTPGHTLTLNDLTRKKKRIESVNLPASIQIWRSAFCAYALFEGFPAIAADIEDERAHDGVILPPLSNRNIKPITRCSFLSPSPTTLYGYKVGQISTPSNTAHLERPLTAPLLRHDLSNTMYHYQAPGAVGSNLWHVQDYSIAQKEGKAVDSPGGIHLVSHHKVTGISEFTYPDYDGILSSGVVPEIIVMPEEKQKEETNRKYYISVLEMTNDELNAFTELQSIWKSKSCSHSTQGQMHRATQKDSRAISTITSNRSDYIKKNRNDTKVKNCSQVIDSYNQHDSHPPLFVNSDNIETEASLVDVVATEHELMDALRIADNLLEFTW